MSQIIFTGSFDIQTFIDTYPTGSTDTLHLWISASFYENNERWYVRGVTIPSTYLQQDKYMNVILKQAQRIGLFLPNPSPPPSPSPTPTPTPTPTPSSSPTPTPSFSPTPTSSPTPTPTPSTSTVLDCELVGNIVC